MFTGSSPASHARENTPMPWRFLLQRVPRLRCMITTNDRFIISAFAVNNALVRLNRKCAKRMELTLFSFCTVTTTQWHEYMLPSNDSFTWQFFACLRAHTHTHLFDAKISMINIFHYIPNNSVGCAIQLCRKRILSLLSSSRRLVLTNNTFFLSSV